MEYPEFSVITIWDGIEKYEFKIRNTGNNMNEEIIVLL